LSTSALAHAFVLWCVLLWLPSVACAQLTRQPYLQAVSQSSVVVAWQTDLSVGARSVVRYGTSHENLSASASDNAVTAASNPSVRNHAVLIGGLLAGTRYYYDVATEGGSVLAGPSSEHFFVTAPPTGARTAFSFWVVADAGTNAADQLAVRDAMLALTASDPPDLFLQVGDMAYPNGTDAAFTSATFGVYASTLVHTPLFTAVGNHEASDGSSDSPTQTGPYFEAFAPPIGGEAGGAPSGTEAYYSFDYGMVHFIVLDSDDSSVEPGSSQMTWLAADLDAIGQSQQWVIAAFHHPPFSKGSHDSDVLGDSGGRMTRMREQVLPVLEARGVDLVLSGHSHSYERSYLLSRAYGRGPAPAFPTPPFAALLAADAIVNTGDGHVDGAYKKGGGRVAHGGTVYVVAGHGGASLGGPLGHPVMRYSELLHGSLLVEVSERTLRARNVRSDGSIADEVTLQKPALRCTNSAQCDDGNPCTSDRCQNERCRYAPIACARGQSCRRSAGGCTCTPGACNDGDPCTVDSCRALSATSGLPTE
jgi:hypothetical protein